MNDIKTALIESKMFTADEIDEMMAARVKMNEIQSKIDALTEEMTQLSEQHKVPAGAYFGEISFFYMPESLSHLDEEGKECVAECFGTYFDDFVGCWYSSYDMQ